MIIVFGSLALDKHVRNYGIDLLRIVAMLMIVTLHLLGHGGLLKSTVMNTSQYRVAWLLETTCYVGVDVYALISGYVSGYSNFSYKKFLRLWIKVFFYSAAIFVTYMVYTKSFSIKELLNSIFPVIRGRYWYISSYFGMALFLPLINNAIKCEKSDGLLFAIIALIFIATIPCIFPDSDPFNLKNGYSTIWLLILYVLGAVLSKYHKCEKFTKGSLLLIFMLTIIITWISSIKIAYYTNINIGKDTYSGILLNYTSPTILIASISLLLFFSKLKIETESMIARIIKILSSSTLGVYLIHENPLIRQNIVKGISAGFANDIAVVMVAKVIGLVLVIYFVCSIIDILREKLFKLLRIDYLVDFVYEHAQSIYRNIIKTICSRNST